MKLNIETIYDYFEDYFKVDSIRNGEIKCFSIYNEENTPSMFIDLNNNRFYCFSSVQGGGPYKLLNDLSGNLPSVPQREINNFKEKYNIVSNDFGKPKIEYNDEEKIYLDVIEYIANISNYKFNHEDNNTNKSVKQYLSKRSINQKTANDFMLGYVDNSKEMINIIKQKFNLEDSTLEEMGLLTNGVFPLENYLLIPIFNQENTIVSFIGRSIYDSGPKYMKLKSLDNRKYKNIQIEKSLNFNPLGNNEIKKKNEIIFVEGVFDMMRLHTKGIKNVITLSGKSLTKKQVDYFKKYKLHNYVNRVICMLDKDVDLEEQIPLYCNLVKIGFINIMKFYYPKSEASDPDELFLENEKYNMLKLLNNSSQIYGPMFEYLTKKFIEDMTIPVSKYVEDVLLLKNYLNQKNIEDALTEIFEKRTSDYLYAKENISIIDTKSLKQIKILKIAQQLNLEYKYIEILIDELNKTEPKFSDLLNKEDILIDTISRYINAHSQTDNLKLEYYLAKDYHINYFSKGVTLIQVFNKNNLHLRIKINYLSNEITLETRIIKDSQKEQLRNEWHFFQLDSFGDKFETLLKIIEDYFQSVNDRG